MVRMVLSRCLNYLKYQHDATGRLDIAIGDGGQVFDSRVGEIKPSVVTAAQDKQELIAQCLRLRYRCGRSRVRLPDRSKETQCGQRFATVAMLLHRCVVQALNHGNGPATRYTLRRNTARTIKV